MNKILIIQTNLKVGRVLGRMKGIKALVIVLLMLSSTVMPASIFVVAGGSTASDLEGAAEVATPDQGQSVSRTLGSFIDDYPNLVKDYESGLPALSQHDVITINNDADLRAMASTNGWPGDGSSEYPYIIQDLIVNAHWKPYCIYIGNTTLNLIVTNCYCYNSSSAYPYQSMGIGIFLHNVRNIELTRNNCSLDWNAGIRISKGFNCRVADNDIAPLRSEFGVGILLGGTNESEVTGNRIHDFMIGILISECRADRFYENELVKCSFMFESMSEDGFSSIILPMNNTIDGGPIHFIHDQDLAETPLTIEKGQWILFHVTRALVSGSFRDNGTSPLALYYSNNCTIRNNRFMNGTLGDLYLEMVNDVVIEGNLFNASSSQYAVEVRGADRFSFKDNNFTGCGAFISGVLNGHLRGNSRQIHESLIIDKSKNVSVADNGFSSISCQESSYCLIENNSCINGIKISRANNIEATRNNCTSEGIHVYSSVRCTIKDNNCSNITGYAFRILESSDCNITENLCYSDGIGVGLERSVSCKIMNNGPSSIVLEQSSGNEIFYNNISGGEEFGILLHRADGNLIHHNFINGTVYGIELNEDNLLNSPGSNFNQIVLNVISDCGRAAIYIDSGNNNVIWGNLFLHNNVLGFNPGSGTPKQVYDVESNFWNSSETYPGLGNYWSDWTSPDLNHDGIVDVPYQCKGSIAAKDWYPLVSMSFDERALPPIITSPTSMENFATDQVTISWLPQTGAEYQFQFDGGIFSDVNSSTSYKIDGLSEGVHVLLVRAISDSGTASSRVHFRIDRTLPALVINLPINGTVVNNTSTIIHFEWTMSDDGSGLTGYDCVYDGFLGMRIGNAFPSPYSAFEDRSYSEGPHNFTVVAHDKAGNTKSASVHFFVDMTSPSLAITSISTDFLSGSNNVEVLWSGSDSGSYIAYYLVRMDQGPILNTTAVSANYHDLAVGGHSLTIRAYDGAGHVSEVTKTFTVVPAPLWITTPQEDYVTGQREITLNWSIDPLIPSFNYFEVRNDYEAWINVSGATSHVFEGLSEGRHSLQAKGCYLTGVSFNKSVNFTIDRTLPSVAIVFPAPSGNYNYSTISMRFVTFDAVSSIARTEVSKDGMTWTSISWSNSYVWSSLEDGSHTLFVKVTDLAGNENTTSVTFVIDTVDPEIIDRSSYISEFVIGLIALVCIITGIGLFLMWRRRTGKS